jgi:TolB-like protein
MPVAPASSRSWLRRAAVAIVVIAAVVGGRAALKSEEPDAVLVMPFKVGAGNDTQTLPLSLAQYVATSLGEAGIRVVAMDDGVAGESPRAAAERLGAPMVLTGDMKMIAENQWRISLRLVLAADGKVAWSWVFDSAAREDRSQLQGEVAAAITSGLRQRLAEQLR